MDHVQRIQRAQQRSHPHLDTAMKRIIDHGVDPADAAEQMVLFGLGVLLCAEGRPPNAVNIRLLGDHLNRMLTAAAEAAEKPVDRPSRH